MKKAYLVLISGVLFACGSGEAESEGESTDSTATTEEVVEEEEEEAPRKSPRTQASGVSAGVQIDIDYGSPYVKGRTIWGDLVPYNEVWRAGADETTAITFGSDVNFGGEIVSAGTYAFFVKPIPVSDWQVILNEEWSQEEHGVWGAYNYDPSKDVARVDIAPDWTTESLESLTYSVEEAGIKFAWENVSFVIGIDPAGD